MSLRRGFQQDANWYARNVRRSLGLRWEDPLCPWKLAEHLGIPVVRLSDYFAQLPREVAYLISAIGQREFSAVTCCVGQDRMIIHNDGHQPARQASNLAHELAHALLVHPPMPPFGGDGNSHYNPDFEAEAKWLGPALLISEEAALSIVRTKEVLQTAAKRYGVTMEVLNMRINVTGAQRRVRGLRHAG